MADGCLWCVTPAAGGPEPTARERLAVLHARFDGALRRFFARRGAPPDQVEDLTHEVYVRLACRPRPAVVRNAQAFVFATATNLLHDRHRRRKVRGCELSIEADALPPVDESPGPEDVVGLRQQLDAALAVLRALKPATRQAFLQHRLGGLSHAEIARRLGVSVSMIEKHVSSASAALRPLRAAP